MAQSDPQALLKAILKSSDPNRRLRVLRSDVVNTVLSAKEGVSFVDFLVEDYSPEEYSRILAEVGKLHFRTCYCSVFDECSVLDTRGALRPVAVSACKVPETPFMH